MHDDDPQGFPQGPTDEDLRREAGLEFIKRLDAHFPPPKWSELLNYTALDPDNLPVVLRRMGFTRNVAVYPFGETPPFFPQPDWHVVAMQRGKEPAIYLDVGSGRWRTEDGLKRGSNIIELGMHMWRFSYGRAAHRIREACGLREMPHAQ